jgi:hypothetical protein
MISTWKRLILVSVVAIALWPVLICAQSRSRYQWKTPNVSRISTVGGGFSSHSSGIGGLRKPGAGMPTGILKSSLVSNYNISRGGAAKTGVLGTALPKLSGSIKGRSYGTTKIKLARPSRNMGLPKTTEGIKGVATSSGGRSELASKIGRQPTTSSTTKPKKIKPVSSFVPSEPSRYQKYMKQGDQAFRTERFIESSEAFDVASAMGRYLPESHLSLVHAHFALGRYYSAAYHLRRTLKYFPDLPMVSLRVRLFYGRTETFVKHVDKLRREIKESGDNADLSLLLGYVRYFDGAEADAAKVLRRAWNAGKDDQATIKAIETFWSGMVAAGKVEGTLGTTTQPSRPAPVGRDKPAGKHLVSPSPATRQPTAAPTAKNAKKRTENKNAPEKGQDEAVLFHILWTGFFRKSGVKGETP